VLIWYIFSGFGIMHQEESGNPARPPFQNKFAVAIFCTKTEYVNKRRGGPLAAVRPGVFLYRPKVNHFRALFLLENII
jgi:hypothetical protein